MSAEERRESVIRAAMSEFAHSGYNGTSTEAIARRVGVSQPYLFRLFPNKQAIFVAVLEDGFEARCAAAEAVAESNTGPHERLMRMCELLLLEPWADMAKAPHALEFFEVCGELAPKVEERQRRRVFKCLQCLLGSRELTDVFLLALDGIESDLPNNALLRRRVELLVALFAPRAS